MTTNKKNVMNK